MNRQKFRKLPLKKKIGYILGTIVPQVVLGAWLLFILGSWIHQDYIVGKPLLSVEMIDVEQTTPNSEAFQDFMTQEGYTCCDNTVRVSKKFQLSNQDAEVSVNPAAMMFCTILSGRTDMYFWDCPDLENQLVSRGLMDLRLIVPYDTLVKYRDQLIFTGPVLDGGYPCGIRLEDNEWVQQNNYYENCIVGVSKDADDKELVSAFLEYIL